MLYGFLSVFLAFIFAPAQAQNIYVEKVNLQTTIECFIKGQNFGRKSYEAFIDVEIFEGRGDLDGSGLKVHDYPHPVETQIRIFNPQRITIKYPSKYALRFTTFAKAYTGAMWGEESSIIYFDSFKNFSPIAQNGRIRLSKDEKDYCDFQAILLPVE